MPELVLDRISKTFAAPSGGSVAALREASLTLEAGELLTVLGPSGSGKTTLLRLIAGLDQPTFGTIQLGGRVLNGVAPQDRETAMVFQNHALFPHLTVRENLALGLTLRRAPRDDTAHRVSEAADWLGLARLLDRLPQTLSGGERQRVALGRALVQRPRLLLLDEPLSDLDAPCRTELRAEILRLRTRLSITLIYVTHDQTEAMTLGDRMIVLRDGVIQQLAAPLTVYHAPVNRFVAGFLGSPTMAFFPGRVEERGPERWFVGDSGIGTACLEFKVAAPRWSGHANLIGRPLVAGVRPEHLHLLPGAADSAAPRVELVQRTGAANHIHLVSGTHRFAVIAPPGFDPALNSVWRVAVDPAAVCFFDAAAGNTLG